MHFPPRFSQGLLALVALVVISVLAFTGWRTLRPGPSAAPAANGTAAAAEPQAESSQGTRLVSASRTERRHGAVVPIDVREANPSAVRRPAREGALQALQKEVAGVTVEFDPISGAPSHVQATGRFLTPAASKGVSARAAVEQFIDQHAALFGHGAAALKTARVTREDVVERTGMSTLVWNQQVDGVPVFKTILKANVTKNGELVTLNDFFLSDPLQATGQDDGQRKAEQAQPAVGAAKAISLAVASLNDRVAEAAVQGEGAPEGAERKQRFTAPGISDTTAELTYMPMGEKTLRLGWDVTVFSLACNEMFRLVVDAKSGQVLYRSSLTADATDATYRVYAKPDLQPMDSPSPFSPGLSTPGTFQPALVSRNLLTLKAYDNVASPNGWINDGGTDTQGNNVDAHTDTTGTNTIDLPRPTSASRVFDFTMDLTLAPSTYKSAAVVQLFYYTNFIHDRLYELGFTETAGNFQTSNFGKGGLGNDRLLADGQDGSGTNNAPPTPSPPRPWLPSAPIPSPSPIPRAAPPVPPQTWM